MGSAMRPFLIANSLSFALSSLSYNRSECRHIRIPNPSNTHLFVSLSVTAQNRSIFNRYSPSRTIYHWLLCCNSLLRSKSTKTRAPKRSIRRKRRFCLRSLDTKRRQRRRRRCDPFIRLRLRKRRLRRTIRLGLITRRVDMARRTSSTSRKSSRRRSSSSSSATGLVVTG